MRDSASSGRPSTHHFDSITEALSFLFQEADTEAVCKLLRSDGFDYEWTAEGTLVPTLNLAYSSRFLYRGQVARHSPCVPGVFRGIGHVDHPHKLSELEHAKCFVNRLRLEEFLIALDSHPAMLYAQQIGLRMHPYALAQHYELATDRLDLTEDHRIAAFFATNYFEGGAWHPVSSGCGVIYRLRRALFTEHMPDKLECIGKQTLPRPGEQKAHTLTMPLGLDLESLPVDIITFTHRVERSQGINELFKGGSALFPPDAMSELAQSIKSANCVSEEVLRRLVYSIQLPVDEAEAVILDWVEKLGLLLQTPVCCRRPISLTKEQAEQAHESLTAATPSFLSRVGVRAVRSGVPQVNPMGLARDI